MHNFILLDPVKIFYIRTYLVILYLLLAFNSKYIELKAIGIKNANSLVQVMDHIFCLNMFFESIPVNFSCNH